MSFGKRLAKIRSEQSINQIEFAKLFKVSQSAYKNYERGAAMPPTSLLIDIAKAYDVNLNWLMIGEGVPNTEEFKILMERSIFEVENFLEHKNQSLTHEGKASVISLVFEYLAQHPETSEKFLFSIMEAALAKV